MKPEAQIDVIKTINQGVFNKRNENDKLFSENKEFFASWAHEAARTGNLELLKEMAKNVKLVPYFSKRESEVNRSRAASPNNVQASSVFFTQTLNRLKDLSRKVTDDLELTQSKTIVDTAIKEDQVEVLKWLTQTETGFWASLKQMFVNTVEFLLGKSARKEILGIIPVRDNEQLKSLVDFKKSKNVDWTKCPKISKWWNKFNRVSELELVKQVLEHQAEKKEEKISSAKFSESRLKSRRFHKEIAKKYGFTERTVRESTVVR